MDINYKGISVKTLREQTEAKIADTRSKKPEFMKAVDELIQKSKEFKDGEKATKPGELSPMFTLPNAKGESISLKDLLSNGPVVLTFYRGSWCPYCNIQLRALQERLEEIHALGAQLVAISPEFPDESMTTSEINAMDFTVLSDLNADVAAEFGIAWKVPEVLREHMRVDRNLDLEVINNGNGNTLPIPATFIIKQDGTVSWSYVDVDYRRRSEPSDIIAELEKVK